MHIHHRENENSRPFEHETVYHPCRPTVAAQAVLSRVHLGAFSLKLSRNF